MTDQPIVDLNEFLATEVMGWSVEHDDEPYPFDTPDFYASKIGLEIAVKDWSPSTNIEQAMMLLDAKALEIDVLVLGVDDVGNWWAYLDTGSGSFRSDLEHATRAEAISLAVARAAGWEE